MKESYAVVFTYSFDTDSAAYLFSDLDKAKAFMKSSFEEEFRIDRENQCNSAGMISEDGMYAKIINYYDGGSDPIDITEFHIATIYRTED